MTRQARPRWHDAFDAQMALWRWYRTDGDESLPLIARPRRVFQWTR